MLGTNNEAGLPERNSRTSRLIKWNPKRKSEHITLFSTPCISWVGAILVINSLMDGQYLTSSEHKVGILFPQIQVASSNCLQQKDSINMGL